MCQVGFELSQFLMRLFGTLALRNMTIVPTT